MTASAGQRLRPGPLRAVASTCHEAPYTFRPMYSTSSEHTRVPWAAHSYNVAFSDEIGHFEYCNAVNDEGGTARATARPASTMTTPGCFSPAVSTLVQIGGCIATDNDFDGVSYQPVWPGADPNRGQDKKYHPSSILFTSPLFNANQNY